MTGATPTPRTSSTTTTTPTGPHGQRQRIVVGVDGSPGGATALAWALRQAQRLDARP